MILSAVIVIVAVTTKLFGCGLPAMYFLKSKQKGMRVGIGMISRGEVGLIVAGVGITAGILTSEVYSTNYNHGSSNNHHHSNLVKN